MPFFSKVNQKTDLNVWPVSYFLKESPVVKMDDIDEYLKINIRGILNTISEDTVNGVIHAIKYAGLESLSDLQFVQEEDLILVLRPIQRRKLIKAWSEQIIPPKVSSSSPSKIKWQKKNRQLILWGVYTKYETELLNSGVEEGKVWKKIAEEVRKKCSINCDALQCRQKIQELKLSGYKRTKVEHVTSQAISMDKAGSAFETIDKNLVISPKVSSSLLPKIKWQKKNRDFILWALYKKYEAELLNSGEEGGKVWEKIAEEVRKKCSINCCALQCRQKIQELKSGYERTKEEYVTSEAISMDKARSAFETTDKNPVIPLRVSPILKSKVRWQKGNRYVILWQVYTEYETELSNPGVEEGKVWEKIVAEVRKRCSINCDELQCREQIQKLKCEYGKIIEEYVTSQDNMKSAFDTIDKNPDASNSEVEVNKKVGKYIPPHLRSGENKLGESVISSKAKGEVVEINSNIAHTL